MLSAGVQQERATYRMAAVADANVQRKISKSGYDITPLTQAQRDELAAKVDANTRHIALESGTERAFTGKTVNGGFKTCLNVGLIRNVPKILRFWLG